MADNRPRGRKRNVTGQGTGVHVRGDGLGTGPVGSGKAPGGGSSSGGGGQKRSSRGMGGFPLIILIIIALLGGGGSLGGLLGGGSSGGSSGSYIRSDRCFVRLAVQSGMTIPTVKGGADTQVNGGSIGI